MTDDCVRRRPDNVYLSTEFVRPVIAGDPIRMYSSR
jgi:hypothetical protein